MKTNLLTTLLCLLFCTFTASAQLNLALGKPVTASSIIAATPASNLTDGNFTTVAGTDNVNVNPNTEWLTIDLGSDMLIENIRITSNPANHPRGRRFMIVTWPNILGTGALGDDPNIYVGAGAATSLYNRLIYTDPTNVGGLIFGSLVPGPAGTNLGPDYTTLPLNIGSHYARYIRIMALNDEPLELAEVEVFHSTLVPQRDFTNGGFEQGALLPGATVTYPHEATVNGWSTTEAVAMAGIIAPGNDPANGSLFEFWGSGFSGVPANEGTHFIELNAYTNGAVSEEPICVLPGESFTWSLAHRGRNGVDVMRLLISGVDVAEFSDNNAVGGTHTGVVLTPATTTITSNVAEAGGWHQYTGTWTNTTGTSQTVVFTFRAVSSVGSIGTGNFLDDVSLVPLSALVTFSTAASFGPESAPTADLPRLLINGTVTAPATVEINITGGTATRGVDYTTTPAAGAITVNIPAGVYDGTAATGISLAPYIQIQADGATEAGETILMDLQNPVGIAIPVAGGCVTGTVSNTYNITATADVSGNVFHDANGLTNSLVDGPAYTGPQLYVNIVDVNGLVVAAPAVNTTTGAWSATAIAGGNYNLQLSANQGTIGNFAPLHVPATGWAYTGEGAGTPVGAGDGTPNGIVPITVTGTNITADFGVEEMPVASPVTATIAQPQVGDRLTLDGTGVNPPAPSVTDPEDGSLAAITITTLPANTTLYYNNIAVTAGQVIPAFDPALLQIEITPAANGTTGTSFTYSTVDGAGIAATPATYTINWARPLPIRLTGFSARLQGQDVTINWQTAQEQNNDRFEVEYSTDGVVFTKAGAVKGSGTTSSTSSYEYLHKGAGQLKTDALYYRLRQVDLDGRATTSSMVKLSLRPDQPGRMYPNPVQKGTPLTITARQIGQVSLFNMSGQQVWQNIYGGNRTTVTIPTSQLTKGTYVVYINGTEQLGRIVVME